MKNIVVTGASSGIGYDACFTLRDRGYRVIATVRSEADFEHFKNHGFDVVVLDLSDGISINSAFNKINILTSGKLYALFNNAYFGIPCAVEDLSPEAIRRQYDCLFGTFHLITLVMPLFRRAGCGRIIQNSSVLGFSSLPFRGAYSSSKAAMESLTDTLRRESLLHEGFDLKVSILQPGPIYSKFKARSLKEFVRYVFRDGSAFEGEYKSLYSRLDSASPAPGTLPPSSVTKALVHALESSTPKRRYRITIATHFCHWAQILLPAFMVDRIFYRMY